MEGTLSLSTGYLTGYKQKYVILHDDVLTICDKKGGDPEGRIHVGVSTINSNPEELKITISNGLEDISFKAASLQDIIDWSTSLNESKKFYIQESNYREAMKRMLVDDEPDISEVPQTIKEIQREHNRSGISERISQVWCTQARLSEALNNLFMKIPREYKFVKASEEIDSLSNELKRSLTLCVNEIKREKDKLAELSKFIDNKSDKFAESIRLSTGKQNEGSFKGSPMKDSFNININSRSLSQNFSKKAAPQMINLDTNRSEAEPLPSRVNRLLADELSEGDVHPQQQANVLGTPEPAIDKFQSFENLDISAMDGTVYESILDLDISNFQDASILSNKLSKLNKTTLRPGKKELEESFRNSSRRESEILQTATHEIAMIPNGLHIMGTYHPFISRVLRCGAFSKYPVTEISPFRRELPFYSDPDDKPSFFKVANDMLGKDITKIALPAYMNEPLSMLQRFSEHLEYKELLDKADACKDQFLRLGYVAAFAFIQLSNSQHRLKKPFNPLLGETFEYDVDGCKVLCEQVSHHPPISAIHAESDSFILYGDNASDTKLSMNFFKVIPKGKLFVELKCHGDKIEITRNDTEVRNLMYSKTFVQQIGTLTVTNFTTGDKAVITFEDAKGYFPSECNPAAFGTIIDKSSNVKYKLEGEWTSYLAAKSQSTGERTELAVRYQSPENSNKQYFFTSYAINLNHLHKNLISELCPTDCRFRPDQRALEFGDKDLAQEEKLRLEQDQRKRRKEAHDSGRTPKPRWFKLQYDEHSQAQIYRFTGDYWKAKKLKDWDNVIEIY